MSDYGYEPKRTVAPTADAVYIIATATLRADHDMTICMAPTPDEFIAILTGGVQGKKVTRARTCAVHRPPQPPVAVS